MEDIKNIEAIKGSIRVILEVIRDIYNADICALLLIVKDMDEDEKLEIFENRLKSIKNTYDKKEEMPKKLQEYWDAYAGNRENLRKFLSEIDILKFCFEEVQNPKIDVRLWKYDYKNRPDKWVIFKEYREKAPEKSIRFEGLSAYSIRTESELFRECSSEFDSYPCTTHLQADKGISPRCKMIAFMHLKHPTTNEVIGLLKVENYEEREGEKFKFQGESKQTKEAKQYLSLLEKLTKQSEKFYEEYSYEKLYGGIKLLELLKGVTTKKGTLNRKIYDLTHHLFCVFYRKEYVGHEEIMTRVTNYADDLADELDIGSRGLFKSLLERRRQHEDLMLYRTERYRDHFMHQFHVFVVGYIILNHFGLDKICQWINNSLRDKRPSVMVFNEDSILRIWFLTSFMHDAAYVFERFGDGVANFLQGEWGYSFAVEQSGLQLLETKMPFSGYLENMLEYFICNKPTNRDILPHYLDSIVKMNDHGVLSALWAIDKFAKEQPGIRIAECYLSALAMSFHNPNIFKNLKEGSEAGISFESFPIPFMLALCDTLQIWGRTREIQEDIHPELLDVKFNDKEIRFVLFYKTTIPDRVPKRQAIRERLVQEKDGYFRSSEFKFIIEFYGGENWSNDLTPIDTVAFEYSGK